jgi:hypothetical protein
MDLNSHPLRNFSVWRLDSGTQTYVKINDAPYPFTIGPLERLNIIVNKSDFFETNVRLYTSGYVQLDIFTKRLNSFEKTFLPPTALILVRQESLWNGTDYVPQIILDGSGSTQPENGYIVSWEWKIENRTLNENISLSGSLERAEFTGTNANHWVNLTVTNNYGMRGFDSIRIFY